MGAPGFMPFYLKFIFNYAQEERTRSFTPLNTRLANMANPLLINTKTETISSNVNIYWLLTFRATSIMSRGLWSLPRSHSSCSVGHANILCTISTTPFSVEQPIMKPSLTCPEGILLPDSAVQGPSFPKYNKVWGGGSFVCYQRWANVTNKTR